jgi:hypothetical protein
MLNKKLIALCVAIATVSGISAHCYINKYGNKQCESRVIEGTADVTEETVGGAEDVVGGAVGGLFGGRGIEERRADREARREQRHADREARRTRQ